MYRENNIKQDLILLLNGLKAFSSNPVTEITKVSENSENLLSGWKGLYDIIVRNRVGDVFDVSLRYAYSNEVLFQDYVDFIYTFPVLKRLGKSTNERYLIYFCEFGLDDSEKDLPVLIPERYLPANGTKITRYLTGSDTIYSFENIIPSEFRKTEGFSSGAGKQLKVPGRTENNRDKSVNDYPLISVILPAYNSASTIEQTIQSVINQTYKNVELIIIDGGSADNTKEIIEKYKDYIDIFISEKDNGIFDAINKGTFLSKGQYSVFIGSDDLIFCDTIENVVNEIRNSSFPDFIYGNMISLRLNGEIIEKQSFIHSKKYGEFSIFHPSLYISKSVFEEFGGFDIKYRGTSDADLELKLITNNKRGIKIDHFCSLFREGGLTFLYRNKYSEAWEIFLKNRAVSFKFLINYLKFRVFKFAVKYLNYKG